VAAGVILFVSAIIIGVVMLKRKPSSHPKSISRGNSHVSLDAPHFAPVYTEMFVNPAYTGNNTMKTTAGNSYRPSTDFPLFGNTSDALW
jgi:hypothetical protein